MGISSVSIPITTLAHSALTGVTSSQHHAPVTTLAHSALSGVSSAQHHTASLVQSARKIESRAAAAATGSVAYDGAGFAPTAVIVFSGGTESDDNLGFGFGDDADSEAMLRVQALAGSPPTITSDATVIVELSDTGGDYQQATLTSLDADGMTLDWTKGGNGEAGTLVILYLR